MKSIIIILLCCHLNLQSGNTNMAPEELIEIEGLLGEKIIANYYSTTDWTEIRKGKLKPGQQIMIEGVLANNPFLSGKVDILALWDKEIWDKKGPGTAEAFFLLRIPSVYQNTLKKQFHVGERVRIFGVYLQDGDVAGGLVRVDAVQKVEAPK